MNRSSMPQMAFVPAARRESAGDVIARVASKTGAPTSVVRTFAKISAPENKHLFSAEAALKAFAHVKVKA